MFLFFKRDNNSSNKKCKKNIVILCGSSSSGKSQLFYELCGSNKNKCTTVTSAVINSGKNGELEIIDVPGSPLIRERMFDERIASAGQVIFFLNFLEDIPFFIHVLAKSSFPIKIYIAKEIDLEKEFTSFITKISSSSLSHDHTLTCDTRSPVLNDLLSLCKRYNIPFEEDFIDYTILEQLSYNTITKKDLIILHGHPSKADISSSL